MIDIGSILCCICLLYTIRWIVVSLLMKHEYCNCFIQEQTKKGGSRTNDKLSKIVLLNSVS
jgi:hypothetical protein